MLDLIRRMRPDVTHLEEQQHGSGRVRHLLVTGGDGVARPCVLRRAPRRELALYESVLAPGATGAPALLGALALGAADEAWLLLEALPERFPDFGDPVQVAACYCHLAAIHTHGRAAPPEGPWAIAAHEIRETLEALPDVAHLAARAAEQLTGEPTLVHGDYHRWNLLLVDGQIRVLDWEHASFAPPIWDLVLLAPEEPGWDGAPRGALATHALQTYHEAGPYARLPWDPFLHRQTLARLFVAARWHLTHRARAAALPSGGFRDQIAAYAESELDRVRQLKGRL